MSQVRARRVSRGAPQRPEGEAEGDDGDDSRAWLGVMIEPSEDAEGAKIGRVYPNGPASRAGLRTGETIIAVEGQKVASAEEVVEAFQDRKPGDRVGLTVADPQGNEHRVSVRLGDRASVLREEMRWRSVEEDDAPEAAERDTPAPGEREPGNRVDRPQRERGPSDDHFERIERLGRELLEEVRALREEIRKLRESHTHEHQPEQTDKQ